MSVSVSRIGQSISRSVDQSRLLGQPLDQSFCVCLGTCTHTCPPLCSSRKKRLPTSAPLDILRILCICILPHTHTHTHTMLPITFLLPFLPPLHDRARREEQRTTTTYPRTNPSTLRVHRFHLRGSPCLVRNPTFNPCTGDTSDNSTLIVNCGASHVARDMIYVEKPINKKRKRERKREREREREESSP